MLRVPAFRQALDASRSVCLRPVEVRGAVAASIGTEDDLRAFPIPDRREVVALLVGNLAQGARIQIIDPQVEAFLAGGECQKFSVRREARGGVLVGGKFNLFPASLAVHPDQPAEQISRSSRNIGHGAVPGNGEVHASVFFRFHSFENRHRRPGQLELFRVERRGHQISLQVLRIDQMARGQVAGEAAVFDHGFPLAGFQRYRRDAHLPGRVPGGEENLVAAGEKLREKMVPLVTQEVFFFCRDGRRDAAVGRYAPQAGVRPAAEDDGSVLGPTAAQPGSFRQRLFRAVLERDLLQISVREEGDPIAVGRKEGRAGAVGSGKRRGFQFAHRTPVEPGSSGPHGAIDKICAVGGKGQRGSDALQALPGGGLDRKAGHGLRSPRLRFPECPEGKSRNHRHAGGEGPGHASPSPLRAADGNTPQRDGPVRRAEPPQVGQQVPRRLVAVLRLLLHALEDDLFEARGDFMIEPAGRRDRLVHDVGGQGRGHFLFKRTAPRRHLVEDHTGGVEVRSCVFVIAAQLLRGHIGQRSGRDVRFAQHLGRYGRIRGAQKFGQSEVENLQPSVGRDPQIAGLQVPVDYALVVRGNQPFGQLHAVPRDLFLFHRSFPEHFADGFSRNVLHQEKVHAVLGVEIVDGGDARVVQAGEGQRLFVEALPGDFVGEQLRGQDLQGYVAVELLVVREVDFSHASDADFIGDAEVAECLRNRSCFACRGHLRRLRLAGNCRGGIVSFIPLTCKELLSLHSPKPGPASLLLPSLSKSSYGLGKVFTRKRESFGPVGGKMSPQFV